MRAWRELIFALEAKMTMGASLHRQQNRCHSKYVAEELCARWCAARRRDRPRVVQRIERNIFIDLGRATGLLSYEDRFWRAIQNWKRLRVTYIPSKNHLAGSAFDFRAHIKLYPRTIRAVLKYRPGS